MTLDQELRANRSELVSDWNRAKESSWRAKEIILAIYDKFGYEAATWAIEAAKAQADDVGNNEYEKRKKEAEWRAAK